MFYPFAKGPVAPSELPSRIARQLNGGVSLHERKLAAWALTIGARVPLEQPSEGRRRHNLPDIDMSGAGPDPGYRSPVRRLIDWLGARSPIRRPAPAATVSGAICEGLGTGAPASYIGHAGQVPSYIGHAGQVPSNCSSQTGEDAPDDLQERALKRAA